MLPRILKATRRADNIFRKDQKEKKNEIGTCLTFSDRMLHATAILVMVMLMMETPGRGVSACLHPPFQNRIPFFGEVGYPPTDPVITICA
mmetsp:Transcript_14941/g.30378  ORF Transcript_14941/g.30378 Transcript_14941/m.30378 type:complete len:90 (+) Transcript_14941:1000-1269(+)